MFLSLHFANEIIEEKKAKIKLQGQIYLLINQSKKFMIIDSNPAAITYAQNPLKCITGTTKPAKLYPLKVNAETVMDGTKTVRI